MSNSYHNPFLKTSFQISIENGNVCVKDSVELETTNIAGIQGRKYAKVTPGGQYNEAKTVWVFRADDLTVSQRNQFERDIPKSTPLLFISGANERLCRSVGLRKLGTGVFARNVYPNSTASTVNI